MLLLRLHDLGHVLKKNNTSVFGFVPTPDQHVLIALEALQDLAASK